ncbi:MAG TPA: VOC family protein [Thermoanaerobaculia bacterium]
MIAVLGLALSLMAPEQGTDGEAVVGVVDHIVYGTPDLDLGIQRIEEALGVRASPGGQHPGRGTRNALLSLGPGRYLEIIGPDPEQPSPPTPRTFGIDELMVPRLVAWAARASDLDRQANEANRQGLALGDVASGSRKRPDGLLLSWRFTAPQAAMALGGGVVPFWIDWGQTPHPSGSAPAGARLVGLRAEHPEPERIRSILEKMGIPLPVSAGPRPALIATIESSRGRVEIR